MPATVCQHVMLVNEEIVSFHECLRYNHDRGTIVFIKPSAIMSILFQIASIIVSKIGVFEHQLYLFLPWPDLSAVQASSAIISK